MGSGLEGRLQAQDVRAKLWSTTREGNSAERKKECEQGLFRAYGLCRQKIQVMQFRAGGIVRIRACRFDTSETPTSQNKHQIIQTSQHLF